VNDFQVLLLDNCCRSNVWPCVVEHSDSRFESIHRFILSESIRIDSFCKKKSAFRFTSCPAVFLAYLLQSPRKVIYILQHQTHSKIKVSSHWLPQLILLSRIKQVLN